MAQRAKRFVASLPGRKQSRGGSIPDDVHARLYATASGITQSTWGRWPWPWHVQEMYDQGLTEPQQVHDYYGQFDHPSVAGLTVSEYGPYAKAHQVYTRHKG